MAFKHCHRADNSPPLRPITWKQYILPVSDWNSVSSYDVWRFTKQSSSGHFNGCPSYSSVLSGSSCNQIDWFVKWRIDSNQWFDDRNPSTQILEKNKNKNLSSWAKQVGRVCEASDRRATWRTTFSASIHFHWNPLKDVENHSLGWMRKKSFPV